MLDHRLPTLEHKDIALAVWSYRCCEPMSRLWPANPDAVWGVVLDELRAAGEA